MAVAPVAHYATAIAQPAHHDLGRFAVASRQFGKIEQCSVFRRTILSMFNRSTRVICFSASGVLSHCNRHTHRHDHRCQRGYLAKRPPV
jgi:hypothetical protein